MGWLLVLARGHSAEPSVPDGGPLLSSHLRTSQGGGANHRPHRRDAGIQLSTRPHRRDAGIQLGTRMIERFSSSAEEWLRGCEETLLLSAALPISSLEDS